MQVLDFIPFCPQMSPMIADFMNHEVTKTPSRRSAFVPL
jgi:hypothetical protein